MSLNKKDVWADLRYALDELDRPPLSIHDRLTDAADLDAQTEEETFKRLCQIGEFTSAYFMAKARADTRNAHEAIEKGLKAILLDGGLTMRQVRSRGHELHELLEDVQKYNPKAFNELERCFDSTIRYLETVTGVQRNMNIVDYLRDNGKAEIFVDIRYESIQGRSNTGGGRIASIHHEIINALLSLIFDWTPKDIESRIEDVARKAVLAVSKLDPAWDAMNWLKQGPVRPRLEVVENLRNNKVLRAAVRKCARETRDKRIQFWAERLRHELIAARRTARDDRQVA